MFHYRMVRLLRSRGNRVDHQVKNELLKSIRPLRWMPCFFHSLYEKWVSKTKAVSVILEFEEGKCHEGVNEAAEVLAAHFRCSVRHTFTRISCCSADITLEGLEKLLDGCSTLKKVHLNKKVTALLDTAVPASGAENVVRDGEKLTGRGITIAVLDTGVDPHEDLNGRITAFKDFINDEAEPYDDNGHGTHCAGDAAGNGTASNGRYKGSAPEANIVGVKVLDKVGAGSLETVIRGIDWCMDYNEEFPHRPIRIMNLSLGGTAQSFDSEEEDPVVKAVNEAWRSGIVVCAAAGNEGPRAGSIATPGVSSTILTVGALDDNDTITRADDEVADFSSRGPTVYGEPKPDLLAPGVNIVSLRSPGSFLDKMQKKARVGTGYVALSGTSMATPIVAGIAALMLQHNADLTPDEVKENLIKGTVQWRNRDSYVYGAGYVNAEQSIES
ncbi:S8 family peptidase [Alteribacter natronophilus]|uniref:S8 family peptidase n=1 Tax=Alteribacter natronophilus TaxID=2583810 RepID=UPI00110F51E8|nr:S8 family peptidase [Alteribacter natronophilus]TMW72991.1 serine protease [Alteribacter natronophilus]